MNHHLRMFVSFTALSLLACSPEVDSPTTEPIVAAVFDPSARTIPTPNDLLFAGGEGKLNVPDADDASDAQKEFNAYLRTLSGFPTASTAQTSFSAPID